MLNEQVMGLLQNNAGNPAIVRRIAEENQLSQTEIAQALKIPEEAAARYMPPMGEPVAKPGAADLAGAAGAAMNSVGSAGGGTPAAPPGSGMTGIPAAGSAGGGTQAPPPSAGMTGIPASVGMSSAGAPQVPSMPQPVPKPGMDQGVPPAGPMNAGIKPAAADSGMGKPPAMQPQGLADTRGQMRRPNTTALPGDEEFRRAFDRIRGARA